MSLIGVDRCHVVGDVGPSPSVLRMRMSRDGSDNLRPWRRRPSWPEGRRGERVFLSGTFLGG